MARSATQKRPETFSHSLTRVVTKRERVVVHRRGKAVAALIPLEDLALLEELEDQQDIEDYRAAKEEWERDGRKTVPWAKIKATSVSSSLSILSTRIHHRSGSAISQLADHQFESGRRLAIPRLALLSG